MHYNRSSEIIRPKVKNSVYPELNLIGLKTRYCLRDKPEECKKICIENSIKFNRTYGGNLFTKLSHGKNTFKDFDHIIVPKYLNKISLKEFILKEKNRMDQVSKLNSVINSKILSGKQKKIIKLPELSIHNKDCNNDKAIDKAKLKNANECINNDIEKKKELKTMKIHKHQYYHSFYKSSCKKLILTFNKILPVKHKGNSFQIKTGSAYFDKNEYVITAKGGVMQTSSLWRSKNMNQILVNPSKRPTGNVLYNYDTNMIHSNAFDTNFKVKNLVSYITN